LRLAGKSLREIKEILGPMSNTTLHNALKGTPPPDWTRRPNAKDDVRAQARELRAQGLAYHEIAARLGVSKSSVSLYGSATCPSGSAHLLATPETRRRWRSALLGS